MDGNRALTTLKDFQVKQGAFFEILDRKEQNFHNAEMAEQILKRAFDYSHRIHEYSKDKQKYMTGKPKILTTKEIKEIEKKESSLNVVWVKF